MYHVVQDSDEIARLKEELKRSKEELQKAREEVQDAKINMAVSKAEEKGAKKVAQEAVARAAAVERKAKVSDSQVCSPFNDHKTCIEASPGRLGRCPRRHRHLRNMYSQDVAPLCVRARYN